MIQFANLGAGYDTFSARQSGWARGLTIVEVDHPASQEAKVEAFKASGIAFPPNAEFAPLDLEVGELRSALAKPMFVACLGVPACLLPETVCKVSKEIVTLVKGTKLVMAFAPTADRDSATADNAAVHGEPWLTRFDPMELRQELLNCGFSEVAFLSTDEAARRYYVGRSDLPAPRKVRLCMASVWSVLVLDLASRRSKLVSIEEAPVLVLDPPLTASSNSAPSHSIFPSARCSPTAAKLLLWSSLSKP